MLASVMVRVAVFLLASAAIIRLSWRSLRDRRSHGFYRFFAFELLIGLAIEGFRLLRLVGRPSPTSFQGTNLDFENTTTLVTAGVYGFIRHPMYASLLALVWCAQLKNPLAISSVVLAVSASGFLIAASVAEERENLVRFGAAYSAYMERTRRFVPLVF